TKSPAMRDLIQLARKVAGTDTSVLLLGETGVGKEWLARAIHADGTRPGGSFIAVNCGALPETLLESELFGHEEGAFTGASRPRRGRFELAHKGTIFLDEIAEMPLHLQVKLLRVLQTKTIQRLGSEDEIQTDVRIMAATNRDLEEAVRARQFRPDLYYRLAVVNLRIPPLRERREDIEELAQSYLEVYRQQLGRPVHEIRAEAMLALIDYSWPGNVRELINVIERAVLLAAENEVGLEDLPRSITPHATNDFTPASAAPSETDDSESRDTAGFPRALFTTRLPDARSRLVEDFERRYLSRLLTKHEGRIGPTAKSAGITPRALYEKMRNLGLAKEDFKE
ncbi:MAG: sigma-54-dependent Fis family transcriptional regulator, partial [Gemmatimonadetes bacterium]|nr:sigma-54-dependent Fis family transcriptional regulator [Gemmatimonadota bacterium]